MPWLVKSEFTNPNEVNSAHQEVRWNNTIVMRLLNAEQGGSEKWHKFRNTSIALDHGRAPTIPSPITLEVLAFFAGRSSSKPGFVMAPKSLDCFSLPDGAGCERDSSS